MILTTWHKRLQYVYDVDKKILVARDSNRSMLGCLKDVEIQQVPELILKGINND